MRTPLARRLPLFLVLALVLVLVALVSKFRFANAIPTSREGAELAILHLQEWMKWMTGIQTAALGGLALLVFNGEDKKLKAMGAFEEGFALAAFVLLGLGIFSTSWILSSLPSLAVRIHAYKGSAPSASFDIYELPLYGWSLIKVGYALTLQHWLWGAGLLCIGFHVIAAFWAPRYVGENQTGSRH